MSKNLLWKIAGWFSTIILVLFAAFVYYGIRTQCPGTGWNYVYCGWH